MIQFYTFSHLTSRCACHRQAELPNDVSFFEWFEGHRWKRCSTASNLINTPTARQELKMMGSASHVSRYSTLYELETLMEETASSSDEGISKKEQEKPVFHTPTSKPQVSPDSSSSSSNDSGECLAAKLSTADFLVYVQPSVDRSITTKLVVSLKSHNKLKDDLLKQLLFRIPYQNGHIFGLEINAVRATLYSVKPISKELVHIYPIF